MAPTHPASHRTAKPAKSILKPSSSKATTDRREQSQSLFAANKKDKRRIKHAQLISKVTKATQKPRRRRPSKKLVTTLDSLLDALPDNAEGESEPAGDRPEQQVNIIKRKSMKSRPGALKRKQRIDNEERARFAKNMGQLAAATPPAETSGKNTVSALMRTAASSNQKWVALRGFISRTLEKKPEFKQHDI